jgi:hypothetical protein
MIHTGSHALGACRRFMDLLKKAPCILQEQLACRADLHAAGEEIEQFEPDLLLHKS